MITEHTIIYLTMLAGWATAIATVGLAIFAVLAWRASSHNQAIMQAQLNVTEEAAASQIADQVWGRQVEALSRYILSLIELTDAAPITAIEDYKRFGAADGSHSGGISGAIAAIDARDSLNQTIGREVDASGSIWRLLHHGDAESLEPLKRLEDEIMIAFSLVKIGRFTEDDYRSRADHLIDFVEEWQTKVDRRSTIATQARNLATELEKQREPNARK